MLNINPNFNVINFKGFKPNNLKPKNTSTPPHRSQLNNLAPLACDTVSFGSSMKLNDAFMNAFDNIAVCEEVHKEANVAENDLKKTLRECLAPLMHTEKTPNGAVKEIKVRIKSPESIREKVASALEHKITSDTPTAFNPKKASDIKKACHDIVGARIVLSRSDRKSMEELVQALSKQIEKGNIKVRKIKYFKPEGADKKLHYFQPSDIQSLVDVANSKKKGGEPVTLEMKSAKSGYMAIHLEVDLSNSNYKVKNTGYIGEIQIVGYDVNQLKEVEDFCYKLKSNKGIKRGNPAYVPFSEYFMGFFNDKNYPNLEEDFNTYTQKAYVIQRKKVTPASKQGKGKNWFKLPTIEECGMTGKIPKGLDFNNLQKIKYHCDKISELTKKDTCKN